MSNKGQERDQRPVPVIDTTLCNGCGLCVRACPHHALEMEGSHARVARPEACDYTGNCERICPKGAVQLYYAIIRPGEVSERECVAPELATRS